MSSVLGVSAGSGAIRIARPNGVDATGRFAPDAFEVQTVFTTYQQLEELVADSIGVLVDSLPAGTATVVAYRTEQDAESLRAAMARRQLPNCKLVPETTAAVEFLSAGDEVNGSAVVALYDLGASGLTVSVVDVASRAVRYAERTDEISGDLFDALIREYQITSGRIAAPRNPEGFVELDARCRQSKEQLSVDQSVTLPSDDGMVTLARESFDAMIAPAVEASARMVAEVIQRSGQQVQAVAAIGGGSRIPLVGTTLRDNIALPVTVPDAPETVAARGAALLALPQPPASRPQPPAPQQMPQQPPIVPVGAPPQPPTPPPFAPPPAPTQISLTMVAPTSAEPVLPTVQPITPPAATDLPMVGLDSGGHQPTMALNVAATGALTVEPPHAAGGKPAAAQQPQFPAQPPQFPAAAGMPGQSFPQAPAQPQAPTQEFGQQPPLQPQEFGPQYPSEPQEFHPQYGQQSSWGSDAPTMVTPAIRDSPAPAWLSGDQQPASLGKPGKRQPPRPPSGGADWFNSSPPAAEPDWSSDTDPDQGWYDAPGKRRFGAAGIAVAAVVGLVVVGAVVVAVGFGGKSKPSNANSSSTASATTTVQSDSDSVSPFAAPPSSPLPPPPSSTTTASPAAPAEDNGGGGGGGGGNYYSPGDSGNSHHPKPGPAPWGPNTFANPIPGLPPIIVPTLPMGGQPGPRR